DGLPLRQQLLLLPQELLERAGAALRRAARRLLERLACDLAIALFEALGQLSHSSVEGRQVAVAERLGGGAQLGVLRQRIDGRFESGAALAIAEGRPLRAQRVAQLGHAGLSFASRQPRRKLTPELRGLPRDLLDR